MIYPLCGYPAWLVEEGLELPIVERSGHLPPPEKIVPIPIFAKLFTIFVTCTFVYVFFIYFWAQGMYNSVIDLTNVVFNKILQFKEKLSHHKQHFDKLYFWKCDSVWEIMWPPRVVVPTWSSPPGLVTPNPRFTSGFSPPKTRGQFYISILINNLVYVWSTLFIIIIYPLYSYFWMCVTPCLPSLIFYLIRWVSPVY